MKNKIISFYVFISLVLFTKITVASEIFNFDVTEVEIKENGNKIIGKSGGIARSEDGTLIKAENFDYDKNKNILISSGNVEIVDKNNSLIIYSDKIIYYKEKELVFSYNNSKAISNNTIIIADNFKYSKFKNTINADGSVVFENKNENYKIYSDEMIYQKNDEKIFTKKNSRAIYNDFNIVGDNFILIEI